MSCSAALYWKNFTLRDRPDKFWIPFQLLAQVGCWIHPCKGYKIVHEMRLVEVAAVVCHIGPYHALARVNLCQYMLEPQNAAKKFRRQPDLTFELRNKMFMAHP